jgi:hypothetical protein
MNSIVKGETNVLRKRRRRKANWIGNRFLLKQAWEGKREERIDVNIRRGRKRNQLLDDLKENEGYWKWREEVEVALSGELALGEAVDLLDGGKLC